MRTPSDPLTRTPPASTNGHGPAAPRHNGARSGRRPPGPSARPAAIVFGIILVVFLAGFVADDLSSAHHAAPSTHQATPKAVPGTGGLVPEPSTDVLGSIVDNDEPPANILGQVAEPTFERRAVAGR